MILKPDPGNPQELYLGSLAALGIDVAAHDVRFVEDNWASPALGAWGLGWEVWLDGLEITQFTYFQQAGGLDLDPLSVEITYGIERILMALQGVDHFKDIAYAPGITYGEVFGQAEYEMSRYYLDDADVDANRALLELYAAEAQRLIDAAAAGARRTRYVLKCSHAFNVLDARGAVSHRPSGPRAFARMRGLAGEVAAAVGRRAATSSATRSASPSRRPRAGEPPRPPTARPSPGDAARSRSAPRRLPPAEVRRPPTAVRRALTERLAATRLAHGDDHACSRRRAG